VGDLDRKPILVSGAHRSGTTWVGKMLAADPQVAYVSEPLNIFHRPGVLRTPTQFWYTYICEDNQVKFTEAFYELLQFNYHTNLEIRSLKSIKDFGRLCRDWWTFWNGRRKNQIPLIKDPFAVFSSEWFRNSLGCRIVIVVRHPAAVTSSILKLGWNFDFQDLLDQPLLMRDWLGSFQAEMEKEIDSQEDLIAQSCLLWRMIYTNVDEMMKKIPEMIIIRHEDFSLDPLAKFKQLYQELDLEFTDDIQNIINVSTSDKNPKTTSRSTVHSVRINSQAQVKSWQQQLSKYEIERIRTLTSDTSPIYYTEADWM